MKKIINITIILLLILIVTGCSDTEEGNSLKIDYNNKDHDIYFVGDGAGKAGNIVTAAATGLVAARDILENK